MRIARVLLVVIAVVCLGVALSYPIRYHEAQEKNDTDMEALARMRQQARQGQDIDSPSDAFAPTSPEGQPEDDGGRESTPTAAGITADAGDEGGGAVASPDDSGANASPGSAKGDDESARAGETVSPDRPENAAGTPADASGGGPDTLADASGGGAGTPADVPVGNAEADGEAAGVSAAAPTPPPSPTPEPTLDPYYWDLSRYYATTPTPSPTPRQAAGPTVEPTPTPDRSIRNGPLPYPLKEKVVLDKAAMLPELKEIYALNNDLVGWISIPDTVIDYPVVQAEDGEYYLTHDFYGEENINGQIILDALCDPYTPSYNLVVSGHHMKNGTMFGGLPQYRNRSYWEKHRFLEFDTLMKRKFYVIFACFYSADYDEDETGFRYNAIIDYKIDAERWLEEIEDNQLYDTGIERVFGDEFITLTTCDRARHRNGRFVVVGRKIREGEKIE